MSGTADSTSGTKKYPTVISLENMKGEAAKSAMPALNWNLWKTTESYPVIDFEFFKKDNFVYSFEDWRGTKNADFSQTGMSFADVAKGRKENPYTYDYELSLFKLLLKSCGK